ncbi:MAG: SDR family NAD(P)-dependent oxidoreductase [Candidatus Paceibacterota bacterium]|jgi:short-subunit dehydrogenase
MKSKLFKDEVILITGTSSGLGKALAYEFARNGANVILFDKEFELSSQIANELTKNFNKCLAISGDVTKDGDLENAVLEGVKNFGKIDIIVANAGFGVPGDFENLKLEDYKKQFETNVFGVLRTIYAGLPEIKKTKGSICIIGSVGGYVSFAPGSSAYVMSKFAIRGLARPLWLELSKYNISVTHIMPGPMDTNFNHTNDLIKKLGLSKMKPEKAARLILSAIKNKKFEVVITSYGKLVVFIQKYFPFLFKIIYKKIKNK